jgi:hypothetical protein
LRKSAGGEILQGGQMWRESETRLGRERDGWMNKVDRRAEKIRKLRMRTIAIVVIRIVRTK